MTGPKSCFVKRPGAALRRALRRAIFGATAAWLAVLSQPSFATPSCTFMSVTAVSFGAYNVFATSPNNNGVGSLVIRCVHGRGSSFVVTLSTGQSNSYASRVMKSGVNQLNYNLYTTSARTTVWGDGTGGSSALAATPDRDDSTTTLNVFGQIPAGQDATVGTYTDNITATVNF